MFIDEGKNNITPLQKLLKNNKKIKILIIAREGSLGDSVENREYFSSLKHFNKNIEINLFCLYPSLPFFKHLPNIDRIYSLGVSKMRKHRCWFSFIFYGLYFRLKNFTYIIDYNPFNAANWKFFTWLMGKNKVLQTKNLTFPSPKARTSFFLNTIGVPYYDEEIPIPVTSQNKINNFLKQNNINGEYIMMNCFGSIQKRTFTENTFQFFVNEIKKENIKLPIIFVYQNTLKNEIEKYKELNFDNVFYFETENPQDLFAVISNKKHYLMISVCTAAIHIASIYKKNSIVIHRRLSYQHHYNPNGKSIFSIEDNVNSFDKNLFIKFLKSFFGNKD